MEPEYADIVEVTEGRRTKANLYLEHGYRLLDIVGTSEEDKGRLTGNPFIRRGIKYVLGRPESVAHWDPPPWQPPVELDAAPPSFVRNGLTVRPPPPGASPANPPSE